MSLHNDLVSFLRSRPSIYTPIIQSFSPEASPTEQRVLQRVCYGKAGQDVGTKPYFCFDGPFGYDAGIVSEGAVDQKFANFFFSAYTLQLDLSLNWVTAFEKDLVALFIPGFFVDLDSCRLTSMTYLQGTKRSVASDQVIQTGKEFAMQAAMIGYQIGWQEA